MKDEDPKASAPPSETVEGKIVDPDQRDRNA